VEKQLFPSRERKFRASVNALQHLVLKFHGEMLPSAQSLRTRETNVSWRATAQVYARIPLNLWNFAPGFGPPSPSGEWITASAYKTAKRGGIAIRLPQMDDLKKE